MKLIWYTIHEWNVINASGRNCNITIFYIFFVVYSTRYRYRLWRVIDLAHNLQLSRADIQWSNSGPLTDRLQEELQKRQDYICYKIILCIFYVNKYLLCMMLDLWKCSFLIYILIIPKPNRGFLFSLILK